MDLKTYMASLTVDKRESLAEACGTSYQHLKNIIYGYSSCSRSLADALERNTEGALRGEDLRPDLNWPYLRTMGEHI